MISCLPLKFKVKRWITLLACFFIIQIQAQVPSLDSAIKALDKPMSDTARCTALYNVVSLKMNNYVMDSTMDQLLNFSLTKLRKEKKGSTFFKHYMDYYGRALCAIGIRYLFNENNAEKALSNLDSVSKICKVYSLSRLEGELYNNYAIVYTAMGDTKSAFRYYQLGLNVYKKEKIYFGMAAIYRNMGDLYYDIGIPDSCFFYNSLAIENSEKVNDEYGIAIAHDGLGRALNRKGDVIRAVEEYQTSLLILEKLKMYSNASQTHNNLAGLYMNMGEYDKALEHFKKTLTQALKENDQTTIGTTYNNLGTLYLNKGDFASANKFFVKSLDIRIKMNDKRGCGWSYQALSTNAIKTNDYEKALEYAVKALEYILEVGDKSTEAIAYSVMAAAYNGLNKTDKAIEFAEKAYQLASELKIASVKREAAQTLYEVYKAKGNFTKSLMMLEEAKALGDSLNKKENKKAAIRSQFTYEFKQKEALMQEQRKAEQAIAEEKQKQQRLVVLSIAVGLILSVVFSLIIFNRLRITRKQKLIIEEQKMDVDHKKHIIEEKQKEILDSINYAKRIQYTLLAHEEFLKLNLSDHFTFFNPKDIVSGDFYWATKAQNAASNKFYLAVCDSTGHGVPGAFMSLLNIGFLSEAINEKGIEAPNEVLDYVRKKLINSISKEGQKDGFDGILMCFDNANNTISYAAANNAPVLVRDGSYAELEADRMPVGIGERKENFSLFTIEAKAGDQLYLYTDGFADQFGGPRGKKFKYKPLNEMLQNNSKMELEVQHAKLKTAFYDWKGDLEQVDDVCIIGIRL